MNTVSIRKVLGSASIVAALFAAGASAPSAVHAQSQAWSEILPALQIQVDASRNRVWVLTTDGVSLYDSATRKLVKRIALPRWVVVAGLHSCAPALAISPSGSALVTSNTLPVLWEIEATSLAVRRIDLSLNTDYDRDVGFTGLAFGPGGESLFGVSSTAGSAWRIDLAAATASKLRLSTPVYGACGVSVLAAVAQNPVAQRVD
jgi:hypothetical protein